MKEKIFNGRFLKQINARVENEKKNYLQNSGHGNSSLSDRPLYGWSKNSIILFFIVLMLTSLGQVLKAHNFVKNLYAPPLGITSSTLILIWDDLKEPDLQREAEDWLKWEYTVFQNGTKIGSTNKRTFTVKGLKPDHSYEFTVSFNEEGADPSKLETIKVTTRSAGKIFNVKSFGAEGDGTKNDTKAIQEAIDNCSVGGMVLIPAGTYCVDRLDLKGDMTLQIDKNAVISISPYSKKETYQVPNITTGRPRTLPIIFADSADNLVITGEGTIDANGDTWWPSFPSGTDYVNGVNRPFTLLISRSSNVLVQGITIKDSPFHNTHIHNVDNAIFSDVKFIKESKLPGRNGDGLDPVASSNILIVGCLFGNQDDSIAIKGGDHLNEYIIVRDCVFDGNSAPGARPLGFAIGSGPKVRYVRVKNCIFINAASIAYIKVKPDQDGSYVEDVLIENCLYQNDSVHFGGWRDRGPISIDGLYYQSDEVRNLYRPLTSKTPVFRNIRFKNIMITNFENKGIYVSGMPEAPVQGVSFSNITIKSKGEGVIMENAVDISMEKVNLLPY